MDDDRPDSTPSTPSRRVFLHHAAGIAAGVAATATPARATGPTTQPGPPLPTILLGRHEVSRLIVVGPRPPTDVST